MHKSIKNKTALKRSTNHQLSPFLETFSLFYILNQHLGNWKGWTQYWEFYAAFNHFWLISLGYWFVYLNFNSAHQAKHKKKQTWNTPQVLELRPDRYGMIHAQPDREERLKCKEVTVHISHKNLISWDTTVKLYCCKFLPPYPQWWTVKATQWCVQSESNYSVSNLSMYNYSITIISFLLHQQGMHETRFVTDICRGPHWFLCTGIVNCQDEVKSIHEVDLKLTFIYHHVISPEG